MAAVGNYEVIVTTVGPFGGLPQSGTIAVPAGKRALGVTFKKISGYGILGGDGAHIAADGKSVEWWVTPNSPSTPITVAFHVTVAELATGV